MKAKTTKCIRISYYGYFRTLRVFPMQVLARSCLPQQILNFPSNLFTHFDEKAQELIHLNCLIPQEILANLQIN